MMDFNTAGPQIIEDAGEKKERVAKQLAMRIRDLVKTLYPNADIRHDEARIGSIHGEGGESMAIALRGDKAGQWYDHATGDKGDVFALWAASSGLSVEQDFPTILSECAEWAGMGRLPETVQAAQSTRAKAPTAQKTQRRKTDEYIYYSAARAPIGKVTRYLVYTEDGKPVLGEDGKPKKTFSLYSNATRKAQAPDPRPILHMPEISKSAGPVVFVEGEKCACALLSAGILASTAMGGANAPIDKTDWSALAGREVILWPDNDPAGHDYMMLVHATLSQLGCTVRMVTVPEGKPKKWDAADAIEEGFDVHALLRDGQTPQGKRLPILSISDLANMTPPDWLIDSLLIEGGTSSLYSPSESFKSFIALDLALSIATGADWRGKPTKAGPVVYVIGEGVGGWPARVFTWLQNRSDGREALFWTIPTGLALTEPQDVQALIQAIQGVCDKPAMVVLDTLARNFGGGDENSTQDMNRFVSAVDHVREATGAHVLIVHHSGKDTERGARGSSVLRAALDTEMQCNRPNMEAPFVEFKVTKQKDIEKADPMHFEMVKCEGKNPATGETITSLVPVLRDVSDKVDTLEAELVASLQNEPKTVAELKEEFSLSASYLRTVLYKMKKNEQIYSDTKGRATIWMA